MIEFVETQLARFDERLKALLDHAEETKRTQTEQQKWMTNTDAILVTINEKVKSVEDSLAKSAPIIEEFITIKHKVVGVGQAGKVLWTIGGFLFGIIAAFRKQIAAFIIGT